MGELLPVMTKGKFDELEGRKTCQAAPSCQGGGGKDVAGEIPSLPRTEEDSWLRLFSLEVRSILTLASRWLGFHTPLQITFLHLFSRIC